MEQTLREKCDRLCEEIRSILAYPVSCYLFGSVALNDYKPGWSDIDFLCLTEQPLSEQEAGTLLELRQNFKAAGKIRFTAPLKAVFCGKRPFGRKSLPELCIGEPAASAFVPNLPWTAFRCTSFCKTAYRFAEQTGAVRESCRPLRSCEREW